MLRNPGVTRIMGSQLVARFAFGMMSLGFVIFISRTYHSYTLAGVALGAETVGAAISGPVLSRLIGRIGVRRLIGATTAITSILLVVLALVKLSDPLVVLVGLAIGLSSPPIQASVRAIYPHLVPKSQQQRLFSLDATLQELIWIFGPVLATGVAAAVAPFAVMVLMAMVQMMGSFLFLINREVGTTKIPESTSRLGGVLKNKAIMGLVVIGALLIGSFSGVEVGTVGILDTGTAGLVISVFSIGSLIGGFVIGPRAKNAKWLTGFNLLILAGYSLSLVNPGNPWWLAMCWFISGLGIAPALGLTAMLVSVVLKHGDAAEAYGWIMTGQLAGYSIGAAVAGYFIDNIGSTSGLWVASIFQVGTILACLIWLPSMPAFGTNDQTQSIPVIADQH